MAQLDAFLNGARAGDGRVVFITGGPGQGKTALLETFARRSMERHPDLLVAGGRCNAYSGLGDPYLPYRDLMAMLTGEVEGLWDGGAITRDHAQRLWSEFSVVVPELLDHGPHLIDLFVPGATLLTRSTAAGQEDAPWLERLSQHLKRDRAAAREVEQSHLFQQVSDLLLAISRTHPLLLILDDIQWADAGSIEPPVPPGKASRGRVWSSADRLRLLPRRGRCEPGRRASSAGPGVERVQAISWRCPAASAWTLRPAPTLATLEPRHLGAPFCPKKSQMTSFPR